MKAVDAYQMYLAIKAHFSSEYNYFKYNGKMKAANLDKRNDQHIYFRLSRTYNPETLKKYYVSNFMAGCTWAGNMGADHLMTLKKMLAWINVWYEKDLKVIVKYRDENELHNPDIFYVRSGEPIPILYKMYLSDKIHRETFLLLLHFGKLFDHYDEKLEDHPVWENDSKLLKNYLPFFRQWVNIKSFQDLTIDILIEDVKA